MPLRTILPLFLLAAVFAAGAPAGESEPAVSEIPMRYKLSLDMKVPQIGDERIDPRIREEAEEIAGECIELSLYDVTANPELAADSETEIWSKHIVTRAADRTVSIALLTYVRHKGEELAACRIAPLKFMIETGEELGLVSLFRDVDKGVELLSQHAKRLLTEQLRKERPEMLQSIGGLRNDIWRQSGFEPTYENYSLNTIEPDGLRVYFYQGQVLPDFFGVVSVVVPLELLREAEPDTAIWPAKEGAPVKAGVTIRLVNRTPLEIIRADMETTSDAVTSDSGLAASVLPGQSLTLGAGPGAGIKSIYLDMGFMHFQFTDLSKLAGRESMTLDLGFDTEKSEPYLELAEKGGETIRVAGAYQSFPAAGFDSWKGVAFSRLVAAGDMAEARALAGGDLAEKADGEVALKVDFAGLWWIGVIRPTPTDGGLFDADKAPVEQVLMRTSAKTGALEAALDAVAGLGYRPWMAQLEETGAAGAPTADPAKFFDGKTTADQAWQRVRDMFAASAPLGDSPEVTALLIREKDYAGALNAGNPVPGIIVRSNNSIMIEMRYLSDIAEFLRANR